jgi:hypothetical protein
MIGGDYTLREMSTQALDHPRFKLVFECGILTPEAPMQNRAVCHNTGVHRVGLRVKDPAVYGCTT